MSRWEKHNQVERTWLKKEKKNLIHVEKKIDWSGKEHKPRGKEKESGEKE